MSSVNVINPSVNSAEFVRHEVSGRVGCITLNRPKALNALTLDMVRLLTNALLEFKNNPQVLAVLVRGQGKEEAFGHFVRVAVFGFSTKRLWQVMTALATSSQKNMP